MKKLLLIFLFFSSIIIAQEPIDSIFVANDSLETVADSTFIAKDSIDNKFSDFDLKIIDSLLIEEKFNSSLFDSIQYVINDIDIIGKPQFILSTELLKERLLHLNTITPFNLNYNPALEKVINSYLKYRSKYYPALMAKSQYYFPMFEQYLDQYDIPLEMKYLAIVESTLNPKARSRVGATGLWQFMYGTGKQFNLRVNSYVDQRQDPLKSTIAACKYLAQLYKIFGDWDLALAAYNSGPGNVLKAIKRSGGHKNYWNIRSFLPRETAGYVPAFYATMYIFKYASDHNIYPDAPKIFNFETDTIHIKRTITFDHIAETTDINNELLSFLNPEYKLDIIPYVKDKNYSVRLPRKSIVNFLSKEKEIYALADLEDSKREKPLPKYFEMDRGVRYRVQSGDFLGKIANKFGVKVRDIKRWNNLRNNRLKIGQRLSIHPRKLKRLKKTKKNKEFTLPKGEFELYTIQKGDSLWVIAQKYPTVSIEQIKKWNNIWSAKSLKPGAKLKIFKNE